MRALLRAHFKDLPTSDIKEILLQHMLEENYDKGHEDHQMAYEALQKSILRDESEEFDADKAKERKKMQSKQDSPKTSPWSPPPPPSGASGASDDQSPGSTAPGSSKTAATTAYIAWTTTTSRVKPSASSIPEELHMDDDTTADEHAYSFGGEDIGRGHIPTASALKSTYAPPPENSLLAQTGDMVFHPNVIHLQYQMEEYHKLLTDQVDDAILRYNVSKPLPLGSEPGHVTIQSDLFLNKDLEYLRYGHKIGRPALSISKMKAAYYPDVGAVRTHMCIVSVIRIEVFSLYGYDYMKTIVLRRADLKEYIIVERDFKYMYPSDFKDLYLLNLQGHLNHLSPRDKKILTNAVNLWTRNLVIRQRVEDFQLGIESYQTQLNLTKPRWDATGFEYKHDYTVISSPRAVTFRDKYGVQMIMRFNKIHKFSD
ncbi:hypothetical protein Tco_1415615, partial [Tanacetum coccineum]